MDIEAVREDVKRRPVEPVRLARLGKKGEGRIGSLLLLLLLALGAFWGVQWFLAVVNYWYLQDIVRLAVQDMALHPREVEKEEERILTKARDLQIPLQDNQVVVTVTPDRIQVSVKWRQPIGFWQITIPVPFSIEESWPLR